MKNGKPLQKGGVEIVIFLSDKFAKLFPSSTIFFVRIFKKK